MLLHIQRSGCRGLLVALAASMLSACAIEVPLETTDTTPPQAQIVVPEALPEIPITPARKAAKLLPPPVEKPPVAVLVSGQQPAYTNVAEALVALYEDAEVYELTGSSTSAEIAMRRINDVGNRAVVAIGVLAAKSAIANAESPVVFCQVFNYRELPVDRPNVHGVAAYSPLYEQLQAWRNVDPGINRVGIIIGEGHDELLEEAEAAAAAQGVELQIRLAKSDQETLYAFRRMSREIDGFWLFPDSRILSGRALREMSDIARRNRVRFAVPNEGMLTLGAAVALTSVATDIAAVIADVLEQIQQGNADGVPLLSALREVDVKLSGAMAGIQ